MTTDVLDIYNQKPTYIIWVWSVGTRKKEFWSGDFLITALIKFVQAQNSSFDSVQLEWNDE